MPLQVASTTQINAMVPYDLPMGVPQELIVQQGVGSIPETVVLAAAQPEVFTLDESGPGPGAIVVMEADGT